MTSELTWHKRQTSIPVIPGGLEDAVPNLRALLRLTDEAHGRLDQMVTWPTERQTTKLRKGLNRLGRCGLIRRLDDDTVELTEDARAWAATGDERQLVLFLHKNVRFVGELLFEISRAPNGLTHEEIRQVAAKEYRLACEKVHPVRHWTNWLRATGCAFLRYDGRVEITDIGRDVLAQLNLATPDDARGRARSRSRIGHDGLRSVASSVIARVRSLLIHSVAFRMA